MYCYQIQGDYTRITFRLNMYVGGYSNMPDIARRVGTDLGFVGCVQELIINHHRYDFREKGLVGESEFGINVGESLSSLLNNNKVNLIDILIIAYFI